jgi:hypothetical protein
MITMNASTRKGVITANTGTEVLEVSESFKSRPLIVATKDLVEHGSLCLIHSKM